MVSKVINSSKANNSQQPPEIKLKKPELTVFHSKKQEVVQPVSKEANLNEVKPKLVSKLESPKESYVPTSEIESKVTSSLKVPTETQRVEPLKASILNAHVVETSKLSNSHNSRKSFTTKHVEYILS